MARFYHEEDHDERLRISTRKDGVRDVYLKLSKEQIERAGVSDQYEPGHEVHILTFDRDNDRLTMHPLMLVDNRHTDFLHDRYSQIRDVVLEGFKKTGISSPDDVAARLESLPSGFVKDYDVSLGLAYDYRFIVEQIEELSNARTLVISKARPSGYDEETQTFVLSHREFEDARKAINRIANNARNAASDVKDVTIHNMLAPMVAKKDKAIRMRRNPMTRKFQAVLLNEEGLDDEDHEALVDMVTASAKRIAHSQPEKLALLRDEVQLATLDALIAKFEDMIAKSLSEDDWQAFFTENPFILSFVFGYPVIQVEGHASVGGKKLSGDGEKIADFLYKHDLTGNTALFEIKKPQTPVLDTGKPYRGGVFGPNKELSGAISQVLDQRYQFQLHFASKVVASKRNDLSSYAVACCVIIGLVPEDDDQKKSLELIRANSRDVQIVTFDELLSKLTQLRDFLAVSETSGASE
tara:strand:- start:5331 stop:6731 length:1401 start_codon:yes stop_codon:yes gene_type:complete